MKTTRLIGRMWKRREACSKAVLIGRGLDQAKIGWQRRFIVRF